MGDAVTSDPPLLVLLLVVAGGLVWAFGPKVGLLGSGPVENGEAGEATVLEVRDSAIRINKRPVLQRLLEVRIPGRAAYPARVRKKLPPHDGGLITGREYEAKKAEILGRL